MLNDQEQYDLSSSIGKCTGLTENHKSRRKNQRKSKPKSKNQENIGKNKKRKGRYISRGNPVNTVLVHQSKKRIKED